MSFRVPLKYAFLILCAMISAIAHGQNGATVRGTVADPDEAVIPGATVTLTPANGKALLTTSASDGAYSVRNVPAGVYSLTVTMPGFASFVRQGIRVGASQQLTVDAKMVIQAQSQEVQVNAQTTTLSVDQDNNASSTVIKGKDLDALSDDPDELNAELSALAGPAAGPNGGQIYVDGFTGGQLPPKSSIREIRVNQNPFSAQYDRIGFGRVEVFTKPGTDKFHGNANLQGIDSALNTSSPFLGSTNAQPPYHTIFFLGSITGPLTHTSSFTVGGSRRAIQNNTIVNPAGFYASSPSSTVLCAPGDLSCTNVGSYPAGARAVQQPQTRSDITPRVDFALGEKNTLTIRYQYESNNVENGGLGTNVLPTAGYRTNSSENTIQVSDTQLVSSRIVNETRFEYQRSNENQIALSSAPQVLVQGYFTGGGSNAGTSYNTGTHIEVQNYTSLQLPKNFVRIGGRLRTTGETLNSNAGVNGSFIYSYLLDPCVSGTANGVRPSTCVNTTTPCSTANQNANSGRYYSSYQCGLASQFNINQIRNVSVNSRLTDIGLYAEDEWKARPNLTIDAGVRFEAQNRINSAHDFAPRVAISYGVPRKGGATTTVLRAGYGIFYDRFTLTDILTTVRQNGSNQVTSTVLNPGVQCSPANVTACGTGGIPTTYRTAPNLRSSYTMQSAFGVDQQLGRGATISVNFLNSRGVHQYLSRNFSTPGAYNYNFDSGGVYKQNQLTANGNVRLRGVSLFGFYALSFAKSNTSGSTYFPTNSFNTAVDYGRAAFNRRQQGVIGGSATLPYRFSVAPFMIVQSGQPYNITTGVDQNGDSLFNDRPSFLPGSSAAVCTDASSFLSPAVGSAYSEIPVNYCTGPALFTFNMRLSRAFGFGPRTGEARADNNGGRGGGNAPGGFGGMGGRGGPGGGRGGPGGPGGFGGATNTGHRYNLTLGVQAFNLFNVVPYGTPVSQLTSTRFGQFISINQSGQFAQGTAVRRFSLQAAFSF